MLAGLNDREYALDWLERLVDQRGTRIWLQTDFLFESLRDEPRFKRLLLKLRFSPQASRIVFGENGLIRGRIHATGDQIDDVNASLPGGVPRADADPDEPYTAPAILETLYAHACRRRGRRGACAFAGKSFQSQ